MNITIESPEENFKKLILEVFEKLIPIAKIDSIKDNEREIIIKIHLRGNTEEFLIQKDFIEDIYSSIDSKIYEGETILYDDRCYETLLEIDRFFSFSLREKPIKIEDPENELIYEISAPSNEYIIFIIQQIIETYQRRPRRTRFAIPSRFVDESIESGDLFKLIKVGIPRFYTLKITSESPRKSSAFNSLTNSFLFNLSYNLDVSINEVRFIDEFMRWNRLSPIRKSNIEDIEPPRKIYVQDLIYHYLMAVSTDSPLVQFLSFYHIAEHFFEEIHDKNLIEKIKSKITDPGFSYKRKTDLRELINVVEKNINRVGTDFNYNEEEKLVLTLKEYIDINTINSKIDQYDKTLIDYYKSNSVTFSKGSPVDFNSSQEDQIHKKLANRIYKTRNAIVHSKEGNKPKYIPFKHEKELLQEIPLIRFIAEEIIIKSSDLIVS